MNVNAEMKKELSVLNTNKMKLNWKNRLADEMDDRGCYFLNRAVEIIHQKRVVIMYQKKLQGKYSIEKRLITLLTILLVLKGIMKKMSSSSGNSITPSNLLKVYIPEVILFMFAKYKPGAAFHIGLDEDVIRNYTEYERLKDSYEK